MIIANVRAREILDSRGNPTVEAEVTLDTGASGRAAVPSGASTGTHEAVEVRDGDTTRYLGKGVRLAVAHVNGPINQALRGADPRNQEEVDGRLRHLDGTPSFAVLGANAVLAASLATARAAAAQLSVPLWQHLAHLHLGNRPDGDPVPADLLPVPMMNILNGGAHAANNVDIQEFMVIPVGAESFSEGLRMGVEIFHRLRQILAGRGLTTAVGDEGGFAPDLASNEEAIETVLEAVTGAGYSLGGDVEVAIDAAASELFDDGSYVLRWSGGGRLSTDGMVEFWARWLSDYPIRSLEDPLDENDWDGWAALTELVADGVQVVGDDLFATNPERLAKGARRGAGNAILVKPNQIGTLTATLGAIREAERLGFGRVVSHRSGETEDHFIADLAVATGAGQIKTGSASRSDRVAKYNRLLRIEEDLGHLASYPGRSLWSGNGSWRGG